MNRSIPKFGTRNKSALSAPTFVSGLTHLALPISISDEKPTIDLNAKTIREIETLSSIDLAQELEKEGTSFAGKVGEILEISLLPQKKNKLVRILLVGIGESSPSDLRKAGVALGRKIKGSDAQLFSFAPTTEGGSTTSILFP